MRKSIHPMGAWNNWTKPPLIVWMSFRLAIPWRVALQQSSPPLRQPGLLCYDHLRSSIEFQRTVTCPLFRCLTPRAHSKVHALIKVNELVAGSVNQLPGYFGMRRPKLRRYPLDRFPNYQKLMRTADCLFASSRNSAFSASPLNSLTRRAALRMSRRCASSRRKVWLRSL